LPLPLILIYTGAKTNKRRVGVTKSACWLRDATRREISRGLIFSQGRCWRWKSSGMLHCVVREIIPRRFDVS